MGMIANFLRVSKDELNEYLKNSELLEDRIYNGVDENPDFALTPIDKSWAGIYFLLTGLGIEDQEHPMAKFLFSGQVIDEKQDVGYGPATYLTPEQVKEVHEDLSKVGDHQLTERFNAERMTSMGVYPTIWDRKESLDYLLQYFREMKDAYETAAKNDEAMITFIN